MSVMELMTPVSLFAVIAETKEMLSIEFKVSTRVSKLICPASSVGTTIPPLSLTGSSTAGCSVALQIGVPPFSEALHLWLNCLLQFLRL